MPNTISCSFFMTPKVFRKLIAVAIEDSGFLLLGDVDSNAHGPLSEINVAGLEELDGRKCFLAHADSLTSLCYSPGMIAIDFPRVIVNPPGKVCLTRAFVAARADVNDFDLIFYSKKWMNSFKRRLRREMVGHVVGYRVDNPSMRHAYRDIMISEDANIFWKNGGLLVQDIYEKDRPVVYEPLIDTHRCS